MDFIERTEKRNLKNLEVGETFYFNGRKLEVVEETKHFNCSKCFILNETNIYTCDFLVKSNLLPQCLGREDGKEVIFLEVVE